MTDTTPPAGWYNDPASSGSERWWDGTKWTTEVRNQRETLDPPTVEAVKPQPAMQAEAAADADDPISLGWHPDPADELRMRYYDGTQWTSVRRIRRPWRQKGGGVMIIFAGMAAVVATIITAMYLSELSNATLYNSPDPSGLPVAAFLYGASGVLTLWAIYRGLEQINDIYENVGWASDE